MSSALCNLPMAFASPFSFILRTIYVQNEKAVLELVPVMSFSGMTNFLVFSLTVLFSDLSTDQPRVMLQ